jgi:hypothetical protein
MFGWKSKVPLKEGLAKTNEYFRGLRMKEYRWIVDRKNREDVAADFNHGIH